MKTGASDLVQKIPQNFDIDKVMQVYQIKYEESMNTVLIQELIRYNRLITVVSTTLHNLINAIEGIVVMSTELDKVFNSILNNQVPDIFHKVFSFSLERISLIKSLRKLVQRFLEKAPVHV